MNEASELHVKDHEHYYHATPCEEGCGCSLIHLFCGDSECDFIGMAEGWLGVNVDWIYHIEEDTPEELKALKDKYDWRKNRG